MKIVFRVLFLLFIVMSVSLFPLFAWGQTEDMDMMEAVGDDVAPAPPSIGADVPLTYFGPAPSNVQKELIGPFQLLKSGTVDLHEGTVTLPLYRGEMRNGDDVWFIATDTNDAAQAAALGLNHSPKLTFAETGKAFRTATLRTDLTIEFDRGVVDFAPEWSITPGRSPNYFPPRNVQPGSVGDNYYTPIVKIVNAGGAIYNLPVIAQNVSASRLNRFCDGDPDYKLVHDKVVSICPREGTVTLTLTPGFSFARPVLYLSTDADHEVPATMEHSTYAPALDDIFVGADDSLFSAVERIFAFTNGPTGKDNPQRQGFNSALSDGGSPLNVLGGIPTIATDYSPLWDLNAGEWTQEAIDKGYRSRVTEEFAILGLVQNGFVTGPDGSEYGSTGFVINCPIVHRFL